MLIRVMIILGFLVGQISAEDNIFPLNFNKIEQGEEMILEMLEDVKDERRLAIEKIEREFLLIQKLAIEADDRRIAEEERIREEKRIAAEKERLRLEEIARVEEEKRLALEKIRREKLRIERQKKHILAKVDLKKQRVKVYKGGNLIHTWKVSTGKRGFRTPKGKYQPIFMKKMHYSTQYAGAPMPYAVFFYKGYAMHGTKSVRRLGRPASHGCVRLRTSHAKKFFHLVKQSGNYNADIVVN